MYTPFSSDCVSTTPTARGHSGTAWSKLAIQSVSPLLCFCCSPGHHHRPLHSPPWCLTPAPTCAHASQNCPPPMHCVFEREQTTGSAPATASAATTALSCTCQTCAAILCWPPPSVSARSSASTRQVRPCAAFANTLGAQQGGRRRARQWGGGLSTHVRCELVRGT